MTFLQHCPHILALSSHHLRPPKPATTDLLCIHDVLFLRDPIDRLRSMYDFYRTAVPSPDPLTAKAKSLNLHSFLNLLIDEYPQLISNAQINLIANKGARIPLEQDLQRAISRVCEAAVVGVVEQFDMCCLTAEHNLGAFFPNLDLTYVPENVSAGRSRNLHERKSLFEKACGAQLYTNVVALNKLDYQLVEIASREAVARFERLPSKHESIAEFRRRREVRLRQRHNGLHYAHPGQFFNGLLPRTHVP